MLPGNGNLLGVGPTPGSGFTTQLQFDQPQPPHQRCCSGRAERVVCYYPASLMASSTLASGDAMQFYDDAGSVPEVANITQPATATWSSYLPSSASASWEAKRGE